MLPKHIQTISELCVSLSLWNGLFARSTLGNDCVLAKWSIIYLVVVRWRERLQGVDEQISFCFKCLLSLRQRVSLYPHMCNGLSSNLKKVKQLCFDISCNFNSSHKIYLRAQYIFFRVICDTHQLFNEHFRCSKHQINFKLLHLGISLYHTKWKLKCS